MCTHRFLDEPNGLLCTREDHSDRGHVYESGSWVGCERTEDQG